MHEPEGLISLQEAARRLGINSGTLRKMVKRGELRAFRVRDYIIRIDPLELRRFLHAKEIADERQSDRARDKVQGVRTSG
jgi:excisionase family DNA binding protein